MPSSATRTFGPAVKAIDASTRGSLEAMNHRLQDGAATLHQSEVKGSIIYRLKQSHFLAELTGKAHLTRHDAEASINPELARRTLETQGVS
ncbi:MAG TPA: hypothetical protein VMT34_04480 [Aggregatilineales bacterium]|nr:hypothetical protein [Aggregatilineales bacterium]